MTNLDHNDATPSIRAAVADPRTMTRAERLAAAGAAWSEWARTATTDNCPDEILAPFARPDSYFRQASNDPVDDG